MYIKLDKIDKQQGRLELNYSAYFYEDAAKSSDYKSESAAKATISTSKPAAELTLVQRVVAPTPKFFRILRTFLVVIGLVGCAILASPVVLLAAVVSISGKLALAGSIVTGVSQTAVEKE